MPKKTAAQRDAERRAEARRRSRLAAQGRVVEEGDEVPEAAAARPKPSMSFFQRIFPPAAPLPGKPPPLAGFTYEGRLRPIVLVGWLLRKDLFASIGMGLLWGGAYILASQYTQSLVGTVASFVSFGALVAAGWLGWRRPWLYGFAAAIIGFVLYAGYLTYSLSNVPKVFDILRNVPFGSLLIGRTDPLSRLPTVLLTNGLLQAGIGAIAGFYGGYLRRRIADPATRQATPARRGR
jgi:hypothetical protein